MLKKCESSEDAVETQRDFWGKMQFWNECFCKNTFSSINYDDSEGPREKESEVIKKPEASHC